MNKKEILELEKEDAWYHKCNNKEINSYCIKKHFDKFFLSIKFADESVITTTNINSYELIEEDDKLVHVFKTKNSLYKINVTDA